VSCPRCINKTTELQKSGARERQRQCELAKKREGEHVGAKMPTFTRA